MVCILKEVSTRIQSELGDTLQTFPQMPLYLWHSKRSYCSRLHEYQSKPIVASGNQSSSDAIHLCDAPSRSNRGISQADPGHVPLPDESQRQLCQSQGRKHLLHRITIDTYVVRILDCHRGHQSSDHYRGLRS